MRLKALPEDFKKAQPILRRIEQAGFEAYFVGGSVRDAILGKPIHDVDIATSAYPEEVKSLFHRTIDTGIQHGTVTVRDHGDGYEVTTFRTESGYQDYRRPDSVTFVRSLSEDLKRRDFTVNALAMRENGDIIDQFGGLQDLQAKRLKAVGNPFDRFHEDALRMMRAVRFVAQLDFTLEAQTKAAVKTNHPLLKKIAVERIHGEFIKMMLSSNWRKGWQDFLDTEMFQSVPGFADKVLALKRVGSLSGQFGNEVQIWTLLGVIFEQDTSIFKKLLKAWKNSNEVIAESLQALQLCHELTNTEDLAWLLYQSGETALENAGQVLQLLRQITVSDLQNLLQQYQSLPLHNPQDLAVNGGDLIHAGLQPGPQLGQCLLKLQKLVIHGDISNTKVVLLQSALNSQRP